MKTVIYLPGTLTNMSTFRAILAKRPLTFKITSVVFGNYNRMLKAWCKYAGMPLHYIHIDRRLFMKNPKWAEEDVLIGRIAEQSKSAIIIWDGRDKKALKLMDNFRRMGKPYYFKSLVDIPADVFEFIMEGEDI